MKRTHLTIAALLIGLLLASCASLQQQPGDASHEQTITDYGMHIDLYTLSVPAERPEHEKQYTLLAALLKPEGQGRRSSDRLTVFIQGGPGHMAINLIDVMPDFFRELSQGQDVLVIDQRGTGYSEPALSLVDKHHLDLEGIASDIPGELIRLRQSNIPLEGINSREAAADIIDWANALGYDQIDLFGVSYGSRIAMTTAANYPDRVNSLILDAPVIPEHRFHQDWPEQISTSLDAFFASVEAGAQAGGGFAGLQEEYLTARASFAEESVEIPFNHFAFPDIDSIEVDHETLDLMLFSGLYQSLLIPYIPRILRGVFSGRLQSRQSIGLVGQLLLGSTYHDVLLYHLWVYNDIGSNVDWQRFSESIDSIRDRYPGIALSMTSFMRIQQAVHDSSEITESAPETHPLPPEDIPVLILAGELDPVVSARDAEQLHQQLPASRLAVVPQAGHGVSFSYHQLAATLRQFLSDPQDNGYIEAVQGMQAPGYLRIF